MIRLLLLLLLAHSGIALICPECYNNPAFPPLTVGRPAGGFLRTAYRNYAPHRQEEDKTRKPRKFWQTLDHFNATDTRKWEQDYWYNMDYAPGFGVTGPYNGQALIFLIVGGESYEGDRSIREIDNFQYIQYARDFSAHLFRLEHRSFGKDNPFEYTDAGEVDPLLKLLNMEQAMEDVFAFANGMNYAYYQSLRNPVWILLGDSYGGILAAKLREKYPTLFKAAVVSGAPLHYRKTLPEMSLIMEDALRKVPIVNSADNCKTRMTAFVKEEIIAKMESAQGRHELNDKLNLQPPWGNSISDQDKRHFFVYIFSFIQNFIQFSFPSTADAKNNLTASHLCGTLFAPEVIGSQRLVKFRELHTWYSMFYGNLVITNSYADYVDKLKYATTSAGSGSDLEAEQTVRWLWFSCNELGLFPISHVNSMWGTNIPVSYYDKLCSDVFGSLLQNSRVPTNADANYGGSNVAFVYGTQDPWSAAAHKGNDPVHNIVSVPMEGAGHLPDVFTSRSGEFESVAHGRTQVHDFLWHIIETYLTVKPTASRPTTSPDAPIQQSTSAKSPNAPTEKPSSQPIAGSSPTVDPPLPTSPLPNDLTTKSKQRTPMFVASSIVTILMLLLI